MKSNRRGFEIFSISFLDVMSCGFGAVVLLVLISDTSDTGTDQQVSQVASLLNNVFAAEARVSKLNQVLDELNAQFVTEQIRKDGFSDKKDRLENRFGIAKTKLEQLEAGVGGLELVQSSQKRASISRDTTKKRDVEVGGIPVDSEYVMFIVDTSGSMKQIWARVIRELKNVLDIHPQVKGFQILNDNGAYLISAYAGKWIPDTPSRRKNVIKTLGVWNAASNSSPVEGLEVALKRYANSGKSISIYVVGDDYTGSSYDPVLNVLDSLNRDRVTGKRLIKIHGVGFVSKHSTNRFSILMREVAKRNGGTFLALPN
jgi:hypothetical protein